MLESALRADGAQSCKTFRPEDAIAIIGQVHKEAPN
jgi:hypothetical protein